MEWFDLIGNAATGGVLGVVGSIIGGVTKYFQRKQEMEEAGRERAHELAMIEMQMKQGQSETENELKIIEAQVAGQMKAGSYDLGIKHQGVSGWVNNIRSLFRPFLTLTLWVLSMAALLLVTWPLYSDGAGVVILTAAETVDLIRYVVQSIVFSASAATLWWFGDRALTPPGYRPR